MLTLLQASEAHTFVLFLDNCRVHHSKKASKFLEDNKVEAIFNVPYGPEYNPIERVWARFKAEFKKIKMAQIIEGHSPDYDKLIRKIMRSYPPEKIMSIVGKTMKSFMGG